MATSNSTEDGKDQLALNRLSSSTAQTSSNRNSLIREEVDDDSRSRTSSQSSISRDASKSRSKKLKDHFKTMRVKKRKITRLLSSAKTKPASINNVYPESEENLNINSTNDLSNMFNGSS